MREEQGRETERGRGRDLKLGTKVLTFVPSKVFRIMVAASRRTQIVGEGGDGGEGGEIGSGARRTSGDLYLAKVSELLNFPKKETK